jgi:hypothetical protein
MTHRIGFAILFLVLGGQLSAQRYYGEDEVQRRFREQREQQEIQDRMRRLEQQPPQQTTKDKRQEQRIAALEEQNKILLGYVQQQQQAAAAQAQQAATEAAQAKWDSEFNAATAAAKKQFKWFGDLNDPRWNRLIMLDAYNKSHDEAAYNNSSKPMLLAIQVEKEYQRHLALKAAAEAAKAKSNDAQPNLLRQ